MSYIPENRNSFGKAGEFVFLGFLLVLLSAPFRLAGQQYADTLPAYRNVVLEEFTAVHCSWCPGAHRLLDSLILEHPGRVFGIAMHPANTSYTAPYPGSPDFRRSFTDAFFSVPFATDSLKFFPGAFINRREWIPGRRERYTETWRTETDSMLSEMSPANIGMKAWYDPVLYKYAVEIEVYCTDTVEFSHSMYVFMTEDSLVAEQNNGGVDYLHLHIFRESLSPQWGDSIGQMVYPGTLFCDTLYFSDPASQYVWQNCRFTALLRNAENEEIITAAQTTTALLITSGSEEQTDDVFVYPNPCVSYVMLSLPCGHTADSWSIRDAGGRIIASAPIGGESRLRIDLPQDLSPGMYFLQVPGWAVKRLVIYR